MLVSFFERNKGGLDYVLRDETAQVIRGNPRMTQGLIDTIRGRQRYTAGVLTEETPLSVALRNLALESLHDQLCAGLPLISLNGTFTRHTSKGRDETHFNYPNLELLTGKPYSLYIDAIDRHRFAAWQEHFNLAHGLPDPSSNLRIQPDYSKSRLSKNHQEILMNIWAHVHERVGRGLITNREELIACLRALGHNVRGHTHEGAALEQPVLYHDGKRLRLKGSLYYRKDFTPSMLSGKEQLSPEAIAKRQKELMTTIQNGMEFRAFHTVGRLFGRAAQNGTEKGAALSRLRELMNEKFAQWERPEPAHPMWSPQGIPGLARLIEIVRDDPSSAPIVGQNIGKSLTPLPVIVPDQAAENSGRHHEPPASVRSAEAIPFVPSAPIHSTPTESVGNAPTPSQQPTPQPPSKRLDDTPAPHLPSSKKKPALLPKKPPTVKRPNKHKKPFRSLPDEPSMS